MPPREKLVRKIAGEILDRWDITAKDGVNRERLCDLIARHLSRDTELLTYVLRRCNVTQYHSTGTDMDYITTRRQIRAAIAKERKTQ